MASDIPTKLKKLQSKECNELLYSIGLVLALVGIELVSTIKVAIGTNLRFLSIIVMLLSLIFTFGFRKPNFNGITKDFALILFYSFYTLFTAVVAKTSLSASPYGLVYQTFYLVQIIILWMNKDLFNTKKLLRILFWVCGINILLYSIIIFDYCYDHNRLYFDFIGDYGNGHYAFTRANAGSMSFITLITMLVYKPENNKLEKILRYMFGLVGFILLLIANRRSDILAFGLAIFIYAINKKDELTKDKVKKLLIKFFIIAIITFVIIACSKSLQSVIQRSATSLINGIATLLGINSSDSSSSIRVSNWSSIPHDFLCNSNLFELIFGNGYMTKWIDFPLLQAFNDLGFFGGIFYIVLMVIVPLKYMFRKTSDPGYRFAQYLFCVTVVHNIANGLPYGVFFRLVLLLIAGNGIKKTNGGTPKKVLYVETSLEGHRSTYLRCLGNKSSENVAILPSFCDGLTCKQLCYAKTDYCTSRSFKSYITWIKEIADTAKREKCDTVHFLCGDYLYRYFGLGLGFIKQKTVVTYHHMTFGLPKLISLKQIFANTDIGVVHTDSLLNSLKKYNINNAVKIEYPCFNYTDEQAESISPSDAKKSLFIPETAPCLLVLGTLNDYKGLRILLTALNSVKHPFTLCIAGYPKDISAEEIKEATSGYFENVVLHLCKLTDEEYLTAIIASDMLVLPYLKVFDGASGPMIDAVWCRRTVIGANHGSMGDVIEKHKLGITFESENPAALSKAIEEALTNGIEWNDKAEQFRTALTPESFCNAYVNIYYTLHNCHKNENINAKKIMIDN